MWKTYVKIADLNVEFVTKYSIGHICKKYKIEEPSNVDITVTVSEEEIQKEKNLIPENERVNEAYYETVCVYRNLAKQLWQYNSLVFHAATIKVDGRAIAFAAKSGTGKTTHMRLWQQLLGENLTVINGDKPIIRFIDGNPTAFGTPWQGKESLGDNICAPLTDICFIVRSETNSTEKVTSEEIFDKIFNQILLPDDFMGRVTTLELVNNLLKKCNLWLIKCNMDIDAAATAYNAIIKSKEE
ncbi:MAG: hypothetical protein J6D52_07650 [Clostridia bacterium]|nr:hypothetical protein [Clostridia bacterium]